MRASGRSGRRTFAAAGWGAALLGVILWLVGGGGTASLRSLVESPETGIRRALSVPVPAVPRAVAGTGATVRLDRVRLADLLVTVSGPRGQVVALADADGVVSWRGQEVRLAYVGRERIPMVRSPAAGWCADGALLPRLGALVSVLARRADAFTDADAERYGSLVADDYRGAEGGKPALLRRIAADLGASPRARLRPLAWQVRIERDTAQVGEDYEIGVGSLPARRLRARLDLRDEGGVWRITGGL